MPKPTKELAKKFVKTIEVERKKIGEARDRLRDIQQDIESLIEETDQGLEALDTAIDHLSSLS